MSSNIIWDSTAHLHSNEKKQDRELFSNNGKNKLQLYSAVASEFARFKAVKALRSKFTRLTNQHGNGIAPPPLAFDRWMARSSLERALHPTSSTSCSSLDSNDDNNNTDNDVEMETGSTIIQREPIIPCCNNNKNAGDNTAYENDGGQPGLISDLSRTYSNKTAMLIANHLSDSSILAAEKHDAVFHPSSSSHEIIDGNKNNKKIKALVKAAKRSAKKAMKSTSESSDHWLELEQAAEALRDHAAIMAASSKSKGGATNQTTMQVHKVMSRSGHVVLLSAYSLDGTEKKFVKPYMTINKQHYDKLVELHHRTGTGNNNTSNDALDALVFCILCRYEAIKGVGSQCAVPGRVFESLHPYLGNTIECFASPLNCRFENYYSAFPSLERRFGSLGSFYTSYTNIREGSYEVNPPFVPEIMTFMEQSIHSLLEDESRGPLSFLIIVPDWGGTNSTADKCLKSKFNTASICIGSTQHVFADGAQHRVTDRYRPSSWDTAVILLQNGGGKKKWPITTEQLAEAVTTAFSRNGNNTEGGGTNYKKEENLYAWEARGSKKGGRQGKNIPIKRKKSSGHNESSHQRKKQNTIDESF